MLVFLKVFYDARYNLLAAPNKSPHTFIYERVPAQLQYSFEYDRKREGKMAREIALLKSTYPTHFRVQF